ncbi:MAG: hypothetical protein ACRDEA_23285, partial [Microcystaceae cyanobacterium]
LCGGAILIPGLDSFRCGGECARWVKTPPPQPQFQKSRVEPLIGVPNLKAPPPEQELLQLSGTGGQA